MRMIVFFKSMSGWEVVSFCVLIAPLMYAYLSNVRPANTGMSSSLASSAMAILTAGAIVKIARTLSSVSRDRRDS